MDLYLIHLGRVNFKDVVSLIHLWLLFVGLHRIMMTKRITENNSFQKASSTHSSFQAYTKVSKSQSPYLRFIYILLNMSIFEENK